MEQRTFENVNSCLNTNIYSYLETSGGQSSNLYLNVAHFLTPVLNRHLWQLKTVVSLHWCLICTVLLTTSKQYYHVMIIQEQPTIPMLQVTLQCHSKPTRFNFCILFIFMVGGFWVSISWLLARLLGVEAISSLYILCLRVDCRSPPSPTGEQAISWCSTQNHPTEALATHPFNK